MLLDSEIPPEKVREEVFKRVPREQVSQLVDLSEALDKSETTAFFDILDRRYAHRKWQRFFAKVYLTSFRYGSSLAALRFMLGVQLPVRQLIKATRDVNIHRKQSSERYIGSWDASDFLVKQELLPVTNYLPDVELIKKNGVKVFMAVGTWALERKTWYAQADQILAEQLGCELVTFPGHHGSFMDMPVEWAATLRSVLHKAEVVNR